MPRLNQLHPTPGSLARAIALATPALFAVLTGCANDDKIAAPNRPTAPTPTPTAANSQFIVSSPYYSDNRNIVDDNGNALPASVVYVALPEGTFAGAQRVTIQTATGAVVVAGTLDGGFDPMAVVAGANDVLIATVYGAAGDSTQYALNVPGASQPQVVRFSPTSNASGVGLDANMIIVFSEPIAGTSLNSAVQLTNASAGDGSAIQGALGFDDDAHVRVRFTPYAELNPATTYVLSVGSGVEDMNGASLATPAQLQFTTMGIGSVDVPATTIRGNTSKARRPNR